MATNYYADRLEDGQLYQDYVAWRLCQEGIPLVNYQTRLAQLQMGENALGLEIKFDDKLEHTGNLWIEVAEKTDPARLSWTPSGIYRDDSWLYAIGNYRELFIFSIKLIRAGAKQREIIENNRQTSQGFLLPRATAAAWADRMFCWPEGAGAFCKGRK